MNSLKNVAITLFVFMSVIALSVQPVFSAHSNIEGKWTIKHTKTNKQYYIIFQQTDTGEIVGNYTHKKEVIFIGKVYQSDRGEIVNFVQNNRKGYFAAYVGTKVGYEKYEGVGRDVDGNQYEFMLYK